MTLLLIAAWIVCGIGAYIGLRRLYKDDEWTMFKRMAGIVIGLTGPSGLLIILILLFAESDWADKPAKW